MSLVINKVKPNQNMNFRGAPVPPKAPSKLFKPIIATCEFVDKNPALAEAAIGTLFASILRPTTILAMPGAKKEDKEYAASKAFISGFLGLGLNFLCLVPVAIATRAVAKQGFKKLLKTANGEKIFEEIKPVFDKKDKQKSEAFSFLTKYAASFVVAIIDTMILFKLIHPVAQKLFGHKHESKQNSEVNKK
jgi:hypothetical protein